MNFRSVADLARVVRENLHRFPSDIDLVVGIPRSGTLAAGIIALALNLRMTDLFGFLANTPLPEANTRSYRHEGSRLPQDARRVLLVDDSAATGASLRRALKLVSGMRGNRTITTCVAYAATESQGLVDISLEVVPMPRVFEWNVMHRELLSHCCVDIDGVLCVDPSDDDNDDSERYARFLSEARALCVPTYPIGYLVTSRLERYRDATVAWLARNGIEYRYLHMLGLPDARTRRALSAHAAFKADVYRRANDAVLFIESNPSQALEIARRSGKPVLCFSTQEMFQPGVSVASLKRRGAKAFHVLTKQAYQTLKRLAK